MEKTNLFSKIVSNASQAAKSFLGVGNVIDVETFGSATYRGSDIPFGNSGWLFDDQGIDRHFSYSGLSDIIKAYEKCPPVYSIINKQAYAVVNGKSFVMNRSGKTESTSDFAKNVRKMFARPNPLQNGKQFEAQYTIYMRLFGYCVILPIKRSGFGLEEATAWWIIPPYMCKVEWSKKAFYNKNNRVIDKVIITYGSEQTTFDEPEKDLIILRDITPGFGEQIFLPSSPIKPLEQNISNLIGIYESKGVLINNRGALGILSPEIDPNGAIGASPQEKEELRASLRQYGIRNGQWKFIISNSALRWQSMSIPYNQLMLTEWGEDDLMVVCDGLNYPFQLLANTSSDSLGGTQIGEFKALLYQDFAIPHKEMVAEQWAEILKFGENNCIMQVDFSHVAILQKDAVKEATARLIRNQALTIEFEKGMITLNQWLMKNGEDGIGDAGDVLGSEMKTGKTPLAATLGTAGISSVLSVLNASGLSQEARSFTLQTLFGIDVNVANQMTEQADVKEETDPAAAAPTT